jgi:hypothetical protein
VWQLLFPHWGICRNVLSAEPSQQAAGRPELGEPGRLARSRDELGLRIVIRRYFSQLAADHQDYAGVDELTMSVTDRTMRIQETDQGARSHSAYAPSTQRFGVFFAGRFSDVTALSIDQGKGFRASVR